MIGSRTTRIRRARLVPIALTTAALSSAVLGASVTGTLSAFNASITNTTNTAASGSLVMRETNSDGSVSCLSSSGTNNSYTSCGTINKYGGTATPFTPGVSRTTTVSIANTGTTAATAFVLRPGTCTKSDVGTSNTGTLCDGLHLTLTCTPVSSGGTAGSSVALYTDQTLTSIANADKSIPSACIPAAGANGTTRFDFALAMPSGQDNTVQGQQVSQPLVWTFTGA